MTDRSEAPSGPLDVHALEALARRASSHPLVSGWTFRPDAIAPRVLEIQLDQAQYPSTVQEIRVDVRWFVGGDYTVHYLEARADERFQCRWDRHPKPEAPREHFHPPPDASASVEDSPLNADHHLEVVFGVLSWIQDRVERLHK